MPEVQCQYPSWVAKLTDILISRLFSTVLSMAENTKSEENSKLKEDIMKNGDDDLDTLLDSEYLPGQFKCYKSAKVNLVSELWLITILLYFP